MRKENLNLQNQKLSTSLLQRSLSLNNNNDCVDLTEVDYYDRTATTSTSLSTVSAGQNMTQSAIAMLDRIPKSTSRHPRNGTNYYKFTASQI